MHLFGNDGIWKRASEPMDDGTDQVDAVSYETPQHTLLLRFAKEVHAATGLPVAIIPGPLGGTNLYQQWQRDETCHANRGTLYGSLLHRVLLQGDPNPPRGFLWFQGESDALAGRTAAQYKRDLGTLAARLREDLGSASLVFLNAQLGTFAGADLSLWLPVQEAEREFARDDPLSAVVPTVDAPRSDVIHYSVEGYKTIGVRFAEAARQKVYGEPLDPVTDIAGVRLAGGGGEIAVTWEGPVAGGDPSLFRVTDASGQPAILSATASGDSVSLILDRVVVPPATVSYGWSVDPAAPWIRDARGVPVPVFHGMPVAP